jgi:hypothetical protein
VTRSSLVVGLNAVIVAVTDDMPRLLLVRQGEAALGHDEADTDAEGEPVEALPAGPLDPQHDRTLELALRGWVRRQTGIELGYVEQLYSFGDRDRDPRARRGGPRVLSIAYLALVREEESRIGSDVAARWRGFYEFFPWEDWRHGRPPVLTRAIAPALYAWADRREKDDGEAHRRTSPAAADELRASARGRRASEPAETSGHQASAPVASPVARRERVEITFGLGGAPWDPVRVLERYELLWEAGLVGEAHRDQSHGDPSHGGHGHGELHEALSLGHPLALDHRRIAATALARLRGKLLYRPVVFELLPRTFTLLQLQRTVEALAGNTLHKQNFRRLVESGGLVEGTGEVERRTGGRPAELFRFRREVLRERPAPGVGLPGRMR